MLETIHEFAAEQLLASGEDQMLRWAHADFFLNFAEHRAPAPFLPGEGRRLADLDAEYANLQSALDWLAANGDAAQFGGLVASLSWYWWVRGRLHDGRAWLEQALTHPGPVPVAFRTRIASAFGLTMLVQGDPKLAGRWLSESVVLTRGARDPLGATQALLGLGLVATAEQEYDRATAHFEDAISEAQGMDDPRLVMTLTGAALANLGAAALSQGRLVAAAAYHEEALVRQREVGHVRGEAQSLLDLGEIAREQRDFPRAFAHEQQGLLLAWENSETRIIVEALEVLGCTAVAADRAVAATRLFGAVERLRDLTGIARWIPFACARYERGVAAARAALGETEFATAWAAGRALSLEQAVAEAVDPPSVPATPTSVRLTRREDEIVRLLVAGKSDREIAEALFVSVRTIEHHVARIFGKLGVRSRTAVAAALEAGLVASAPAMSD
jgi:non-specific serine/threonine protein kinase